MKLRTDFLDDYVELRKTLNLDEALKELAKKIQREAIEAAVEVAKVKDVTHLSIGATEKKFIVDKQSILSLLNK